MSFTRVISVNKSDRVYEERSDDFLYKDGRFILDTQVWYNKIVDFPLEIACLNNSKIAIHNCEFKKGLILRLNSGVEINSILIFSSEITNGLKLYGSDHVCNKVNNSIYIDSCSIDNTQVIQLEMKEFNIYKTDIGEINIESNIIQKLVIDQSNIGLLLEHSNEINIVNIQAGSFNHYKIIPKKIFSELKIRYLDDEVARDASLRTVDLLLRNKNITLPSYETSNLQYERNRIQTKSVIVKILLWMFGYFQSPMRYLVTALIWFSFVAVMLAVASIQSEEFFSISEILRLTVNSFIGLSYTLNDSDDYYSSIILSISIGMGTVLYGGLLVTLINRFKV